MSLWTHVFRKDLRMLQTLAMVSMVCVIVLGLLFAVLSYRSHNPLSPGLGVGVMTTILSLEMFYLPFLLITSIVREWRGSAGFWLQSPESGWALMASKIVSSCLWTLALEVVTFAFVLWSFHVMVNRVPMTIHVSQGIQWAIHHQLILGGYLVIGLLLIGLSMGIWLALISMVMRSLRYRVKGLPWIAALVVFLIPTWGLSAFANTSFFHRLFDFGAFTPPGLNLSSAFAHAGVHLFAGQLLWNVVVLGIVFYLSGWLLDKRVEI